LRPATTVSLRVAQSIARHNSFVAEVNVPNPVIGQSEDLSFASIVMGAKAVN
jgi:hypothetical protein